MRRIIVAILFFLVLGFQAQENENIFLNRDFGFSYQAEADTSEMMHTSVKPFLKREFSNYKNTGIETSLGNYFSILPILDLTSGIDFYNGNFAGAEGAGMNVYFEPHKKLGFNIQYNYLQQGGLNYVDNLSDSLNVITGFARTFQRTNRDFSNQVKGYLSYSPNDIFNLQTGIGQHFFGDGYRSLLLSDNAIPMPYFKITTDVWRVKYINLYAMQRDIRGIYKYDKKFTASHYFDWSISPKVNLSLFETVVWLQKDTLLSRGVELNYLNPIIFYRPIEYAQGSADNVLMGLNFKVKISKKTTVYSQLILDEFKLDEIRADSGWWANKYGGQLGVKSYDIGGIDGLFAQVEFNGVRPFTYSHSNTISRADPINTIQNYGHANQSMAHPLAADFYEYLAIVRYQKNKWLFENKFNYMLYGSDSTSGSYGGDIYKAYDLREKEYHNYMIQGVQNVLIQNDIRVAYHLSEKFNLWTSLGYLHRLYQNDFEKNSTSYVYLSIRTAIANRNYDY